MSNFRAALAQGLGQARLMEQNKKDIKLKLEELVESLFEETGGGVRLEIELDKEDDDYKLFGVPVYDLVFSSPRNESLGRRAVGTWTEDKLNGYPCQLRYGRNVWTCTSAEEIESAFSEFVNIPVIAGYLLTLMSG